MADNSSLNTATGAETYASDDINGVKYWRTKIGTGADGTYYDASAVNPIPAMLMGTLDAALTVFKTVDLDESEEAVKASAGNVYGWYIANLSATTRYVKFYNGTVAGVTVGHTEPRLTLPLPAGAAANLVFPSPLTFSIGITIAATTGPADNNTGAPAANEIIANVFYK